MSRLNLGDSLILDTDYSESEVKTGATWIDGKPIYRKTFTGTSGTGGSGGRAVIDTNINDVDKIIDLYGMVFNGGLDYLPVNYFIETTNCSSCWYNKANNRIVQQSGTNNPVSQPMVVTILYTKTTD